MGVPVLEERFEAEGLPKGWYTDTPAPRYGGGRWDCRIGDGAMVPLSRDAWGELWVEFDLEELGAKAAVFCGLDARQAFQVSLKEAPGAVHQAMESNRLLGRACVGVPCEGGACRLLFHWTASTMTASAGGVVLLSVANLRGSVRAGLLQVGVRDAIVRRVAVRGVSGERAFPSSRALGDGYPLEVTVDFNDDLLAAPWKRETFEALFAELKSWGTTRVSWIDLGRGRDGYFDHAPLPISRHAAETVRNVGDIFTRAVEVSHRHGIEFAGLLKPFEMAIAGWTWPPNSPQARQHGRIPRIGGSSGWATWMAAENQDLVMARKPSAHGPARNRTWTRIELVKDDAGETAISVDDLALFVSDDNEAYRPYEGPCTRWQGVESRAVYEATPSGPRPTGAPRRARVFRLDGLRVSEPFVALGVRGSQRSFSNTLADLVRVWGESGEETHLTYGLLLRQAPDGSSRAASADGPGWVAPRWGFEFDCFPGSPTSALTCGADGISMPLALDRGMPAWLGLARGKDRGPLAVFSPSFPRARAIWLSWIEAMLDAGADSIDIRPGHHHSDFAWIEYGFEAPVRDEMLKRTGVDIWETDEFDRNQWRRVRGEGYTQFLREAASLVRGRGRKLALHVDSSYDAAPGTGGAMNLHFDWRAWLREGLADRVTGKALWPGSAFAREVLDLCHSLKIPVTYVPYCVNFFESSGGPKHTGPSPLGCEVPVERHVRWGREQGFDGFGLYECGSVLNATPEGGIRYRLPGAPALRGVLRRHFSAPAA